MGLELVILGKTNWETLISILLIEETAVAECNYISFSMFQKHAELYTLCGQIIIIAVYVVISNVQDRTL